MIYILFLIQLNGPLYSAEPVAAYSNMDECFEARELLVLELGRPVVNYQAVCIQTTGK